LVRLFYHRGGGVAPPCCTPVAHRCETISETDPDRNAAKNRALFSILSMDQLVVDWIIGLDSTPIESQTWLILEAG
jgi:hypothetical protein